MRRTVSEASRAFDYVIVQAVPRVDRDEREGARPIVSVVNLTELVQLLVILLAVYAQLLLAHTLLAAW